MAMSERRCATCKRTHHAHTLLLKGEGCTAYVPEERREGERRVRLPELRTITSALAEQCRDYRVRSSTDRRTPSPSVEPTTGRDRSQGAPERNFIQALDPNHQRWCEANDLALCSGCSVKHGWHYNGATGEPTNCARGEPHRWYRKGCTCHRRKGDRRATPDSERNLTPGGD